MSQNSNSVILSISQLNKSYGERKVVDQLTFDVSKGEVIGLLGPNGAGKSTTIRMITGIENADSGEVYYCGKRTEAGRYSIRKEAGVVPQDIAVYPDLSAYDNVKFFCSLYGFRGDELKTRVNEALEFTGLWERRKERPGKFSGGMKRRLNIACSIAHSPKLLIMDEPTVGIDPQSRNYILKAVRTLNERGTTIIYVSHYMEEIESLCSRVIIMDHGAVLEDQPIDELKEQFKLRGANNLEEIFLQITGTKLRDEEA